MPVHRDLRGSAFMWRRPSSHLVFQQIRDEHVHLILADLSLVDPNLLLLDPGAADVAVRVLRRALISCFEGRELPEQVLDHLCN